jgi:hypothetical protein
MIDAFSIVVVDLALPVHVVTLTLVWTVCMLIILVRCSRTTTTTTKSELRKAYHLAKKELQIVQQASMDVSTIQLFFPAETFQYESCFASSTWLDHHNPLEILSRILRVLLQWTTTVRMTKKVLVQKLLRPYQKDNQHHQHDHDHDNRMILILQLVQRIQSPPSSSFRNSKVVQNQYQYHEHRLHVLGCALWFRFHIQAKLFVTNQDLVELLLACQPYQQSYPSSSSSSLHNDHDNTNNNNNHGLSFMNQTLEWAVLPNMDRLVIRYCLDALAYVMRGPGASHNVMPEEIIILLLDCILQTYKTMDTSPWTRELDQHQQQEQSWTEKDPEVMVEVSAKGISRTDDGAHHGRNTSSSTRTHLAEEKEDLLPLLFDTAVSSTEKNETTSRQQPQQLKPLLFQNSQQQAKRIFGYLHLLGVFLSDNNKNATDNYSRCLVVGEHCTMDQQQQQYDKEERITPLPSYFFTIRPGILQVPKVPPPHCALWTKIFATRLLDNLHNNNCSSSSSSSSSLYHYCHHNLPSLLIHLGCYAQASQLLHTNQTFATNRRQTMGLTRTIETFVSDYEHLHQSMRLALVLLPDNKIMGNTITSPTIQWLCVQTLAIACSALDPSSLSLSSSSSSSRSNKKDCQQEIAKACYQMGIFAVHQQQHQQQQSAVVGDHQQIIMRLLQDGRRLQLLVLEATCRLLAKSIQNLGTTLYIREKTFQPKKNRKEMGANRFRSTSHLGTTLSSSTNCFAVSQQLVDAIATTCQDYKGHTTDTTIAEVATCICQALVKGWRELLPSLHVASPDPTADGVGFRTKLVMDQWHQSKEAFRLFADFQVALCSHLPCSEAQGTATNDFLEALSDAEGIL